MEPREAAAPKISALRRRLLDWYERHRRNLPWRHGRDPYAIWVSEIMLQQTRVAVVIERYRAFMEHFPTLVSLALGSEDEVLALWSGLGYYRRARLLHKAAQFVAAQYNGNLPRTAGELRALPGIGAYTAAAIASIAHGERVAVIDGNVERVLCRLEGWEGGANRAGSSQRRSLEELADRLLSPERPGDFNQALMELGATVCTPRNPRCLVCPIAAHCTTRGEHKMPPRPAMLSREIAHALALRAMRSGKAAQPHRDEILLERRPAHLTVMPGLWQLPALLDAAVPEAVLRMTVRHAIMQVNYYVRIRVVEEKEVDGLTEPGGERRWVPLAVASQMALTGLTRKVLTRARLMHPAPADALPGD